LLFISSYRFRRLNKRFNENIFIDKKKGLKCFFFFLNLLLPNYPTLLYAVVFVCGKAVQFHEGKTNSTSENFSTFDSNCNKRVETIIWKKKEKKKKIKNINFEMKENILLSFQLIT